MPKEITREIQLFQDLQQRASRPESTPDELNQVLLALRGLAHVRTSGRGSAYGQVVERLCAHPNIAPTILQSLLADYATTALRGFYRNPVLPFLALEYPAFWDELAERAVRAMVRRPDLPPIAARALRTYPRSWYALEAETHIACAGELSPESYEEARACLERRLADILAQDKDQEMRALLFDMVEEGIAPSWAALGQDPEETEYFQSKLMWISDENVEGWLKEGRGVISAMEAWVVEHPLFKAGGFRRFAACRLARHPRTPREVLADLQKDGDVLVRRAIRRHPRADAYLRSLNRQYTIEALGRMTYSPCNYFSAGYITPARLRAVRGALMNGDFLSRLALAQQLRRYPRNGGDRKLLQELTRDPNRYVRAVARHPELSI